MNIITIKHLCYYLEEIGVIDQNSINPFLSLYSFAMNRNKEINSNSNNTAKRSCNLFESVLCAYLKKIFSVDKNFKIFSNKIINKFKQQIMLRQYNGFILLFSIISKKYMPLKILSFYSILRNNKNKNKNLNPKHKPYEMNNISSPAVKKESKKKKSFDGFRSKNKNNNKNENRNSTFNTFNTSKTDIFNKSLDFIKLNNIYSTNNTLSWHSRNNMTISSFNKNLNIQLEFQKKQILSRIRREHNVKFKRSNSNSAKKLNNNNSNKTFESILLNTFSQKCNSINSNRNNNNFIAYNNNGYKSATNRYKDMYFHQKFNNINFIEEKESLQLDIPDILRGQYSTKSENMNFNSFSNNSPSSFKNIHNNYFLNRGNKGHIIKKNSKTKLKKDLFRSNGYVDINGDKKKLTLNDINQIKHKLDVLNNINYYS